MRREDGEHGGIRFVEIFRISAKWNVIFFNGKSPFDRVYSRYNFNIVRHLYSTMSVNFISLVTSCVGLREEEP